jgi:hypothetical protein
MADFGRYSTPQDAYDAGLVGAYRDPRADEVLVDTIVRGGGNPIGSEVAHEWAFAGVGKGKLSATWMHVVETWPGCWPGPAQDIGDCVSQGSRSAALTSWTCELIDGRPDEVTGLVEGKPEVSLEGIANGVLSTEALFWWRGHNGDGWNCAAAANALMNDAGIWLRKAYPEIKIDLTKYSGDMAQRWGARNPPDEVRQIGRQHLVRTATVVKTREEVRDFLAAGFGVFFCSGLKWSNQRDENGVSKVVFGSWAHCQCVIGYDDRPEIIKLYGEPLALILNSWGKNWIQGSRKVFGTNLLIPDGAYWTPVSALDSCSCIAVSSVAGWPRRKLKSYGAKGRV